MHSNMEILTTPRLTTRFPSVNNVHNGKHDTYYPIPGIQSIKCSHRDFSSTSTWCNSHSYSVYRVRMECISIEWTAPVSFIFRAYASTKLSNLSRISFSRIVLCTFLFSFIFPSLENVLICINFRCYAKSKFTGEINIMAGIRRCCSCIRRKKEREERAKKNGKNYLKNALMQSNVRETFYLGNTGLRFEQSLWMYGQSLMMRWVVECGIVKTVCAYGKNWNSPSPDLVMHIIYAAKIIKRTCIAHETNTYIKLKNEQIFCHFSSRTTAEWRLTKVEHATKKEIHAHTHTQTHVREIKKNYFRFKSLA